MAAATKDNLVRREHLTDREYERVGKLFAFIVKIKARRAAESIARAEQ